MVGKEVPIIACKLWNTTRIGTVFAANLSWKLHSSCAARGIFLRCGNGPSLSLRVLQPERFGAEQTCFLVDSDP